MSSAVGENQRANPQHPDEPRRTEYLRHIGYDELGQRVRVVAGNGVETTYGYDESTRRMVEVKLLITALRTTLRTELGRWMRVDAKHGNIPTHVATRW
ncbi:hypothetical protein [Sorangium cellulosum]|uniref:hypothetical protein n=1 Tax=Sorangium cellulosum TaxID=56 RepID=UPI001F29D408|nr:hypothetical protein [Sorangium cellulosum]